MDHVVAFLQDVTLSHAQADKINPRIRLFATCADIGQRRIHNRQRQLLSPDSWRAGCPAGRNVTSAYGLTLVRQVPVTCYLPESKSRSKGPTTAAAASRIFLPGSLILHNPRLHLQSHYTLVETFRRCVVLPPYWFVSPHHLDTLLGAAHVDLLTCHLRRSWATQRPQRPPLTCMSLFTCFSTSVSPQ